MRRSIPLGRFGDGLYRDRLRDVTVTVSGRATRATVRFPIRELRAEHCLNGTTMNVSGPLARTSVVLAAASGRLGNGSTVSGTWTFSVDLISLGYTLRYAYTFAQPGQDSCGSERSIIGSLMR